MDRAAAPEVPAPAPGPPPADRGAYHVLVGGDAFESQGPDLSRRDLVHTSVTFVGEAYASLREAGVPRDRIITIVQLEDHLRAPGLAAGGYPAPAVKKACERLLAEGGADYDFDAVNPGTVVAVLRGMHRHSADDAAAPPRWPKVVPRGDGSAVFLSVYSHGDSHPASAAAAAAVTDAAERRRADDRRAMAPSREPEPLDPLQHEWFAHMPYPTQPEAWADELLAAVATQLATAPGRRRPRCFLYASQLKGCFSELFAAAPDRPVVALFNFCRSGGMLAFARSPAARAAYGADGWPLLLMSSSQPEHDALVGGLWSAWFAEVAKWAARARGHAEGGEAGVDGAAGRTTLGELATAARESYFRQNVYELKDHVCTLAYASNYGKRGCSYSHDLFELCAGGAGGEPDWDGLARLQQEYADGTHCGRAVQIWDPQDWGGEPVDLVEAVREARRKIAIPDIAMGAGGTAELRMADLMGSTSPP